MVSDSRLVKVTAFSDLLKLVAQDDEGLNQYVYSKLVLGDVWWIPDSVTYFGKKERHPWVVVLGYSPRRSTVVICPRTTKPNVSSLRGILTPAGVLEGLDQQGTFILDHRQSFQAERFREFSYIGRLPEHWLQRIRIFNQALNNQGKSRC